MGVNDELDPQTLAHYRRVIEQAASAVRGTPASYLAPRLDDATAAIFAALDRRDSAWQKLRAENASLREIAQAVVSYGEPCACRMPTVTGHGEKCWVTKARALLGETQTQKASEEGAG